MEMQQTIVGMLHLLDAVVGVAAAEQSTICCYSLSNTRPQHIRCSCVTAAHHIEPVSHQASRDTNTPHHHPAVPEPTMRLQEKGSDGILMSIMYGVYFRQGSAIVASCTLLLLERAAIIQSAQRRPVLYTIDEGHACASAHGLLADGTSPDEPAIFYILRCLERSSLYSQTH